MVSRILPSPPRTGVPRTLPTMPNPVVHIVDDDQAARESLCALVASLGYTTRAYVAAEEFLHSLPMTDPGCLILDVRLPGMSGIDLQRELASSQAAIPVILVSGHADAEARSMAMDLDAVAFLDKPFAHDEFSDALARALNMLA